jgi:hypothetical protein
MDGSTLVQDFFDGAQFPFSLDVDVEGVGVIGAGRFKEHTKTENTESGTVTVVHNDFANANRSAVASGTVTLDGIALVPEFFLRVHEPKREFAARDREWKLAALVGITDTGSRGSGWRN